jgi:hypothetical protein
VFVAATQEVFPSACQALDLAAMAVVFQGGSQALGLAETTAADCCSAFWAFPWAGLQVAFLPVAGRCLGLPGMFRVLFLPLLAAAKRRSILAV